MTPQIFNSVWENLFSEFREGGKRVHARSISISYVDSSNTRYMVRVSLEAAAANAISVSTTSGVSATPLLISREMTPMKSNTIKSAVLLTLNQQGQIQANSALSFLGPSAFVFSATTAYAESENIQWFSQLREDGNSADVISFITEAFPFITNLEILSSSGTPGIYASLTDGGLRKLQLISSGINKIITILLACARAKGGIVLIDEIENGIFYDKYELMWSILYKFAKRFNFQLFVTSHSLECLERIVPVIGDNEKDFSLIRTERETINASLDT